MGRIAVILLAAGAGTRMGGDKLALRLGGRSLLEHALAAWERWDEPCARVLVVRPGQAPPPAAVGWRTVENPRAAEGMGSSLAVGVAAVEADAYLLGLADLPALHPDTPAALAAAWRAGAGPLLRPTFRGRAGHPVLADAALRERLLGCAGDEGARGLVRELGCALVAVDDPGAVLDVDSPGDLAGLETRAGALRWREGWWPSPS